MTREEIFKIIDGYNQSFAEKVLNEEEREEMVAIWYKKLEAEIAFCLGVDQDEYWDRLFKRMASLIDLPVLELKRLYVKDEALDNLFVLANEIRGIDYNKCVDSEIMIDGEKYNSYKESINNNMKLVKYFNFDKANEYYREMTANLEYIYTNDIEKASDKIKKYYDYIKENKPSKTK